MLGVSLKMYFDRHQTSDWCENIAELARRSKMLVDGTATLFVLPDFTMLERAIAIFADSPVQVGAQDLFWDDRGAFTGEVSGADLAALGCEYVEIGHAERRRLFAETDETIALKVAAAVRNRLVPVLCVGEGARVGDGARIGEEALPDPAAAASHCIQQLGPALAQVEATGIDELVVAYEPVWAIGAEQAASVDHVTAVAAALRNWLAESPLIHSSRVIYGGSAGPGLLTELGASVDGLFLGRFAHDPARLELILDEAAALRDPGMA
jgi:triosephosphate isomerase